MQTWKLEITVKVADTWVSDGFDMSERLEDLQNDICAMLPYAYGNEITAKAKIIAKPTKDKISQLQGY